MTMNLARESIELLGQIVRFFLFEGVKHGLRDREWMALRFLASANRFSRTPSALASYVGTTRGTASYIINELERLGYIEKTRSAKDKRSVTLSVTAQGKKFLGRDPISVLADAIAVLEDDRKIGFRDALRHVLDQSDAALQTRHADICKGCIFLREGRSDGEGKAPAEFTCRLFRAAITEAETELLCTSFERRKH
jgi:MarR family transcriptional regulator, negative regulator of the multidrug operon emrRAB